MTECQGCGAWNDARRTVCVLCGTPLAETDEWDAAAELPPLPPLPDGGLAASMPVWLREPPAAAVAPVAAAVGAERAAALPPLGPRADPRTFLSDDDFPRWLRELAARREAAAPPLTTLEPLVPAHGAFAPPPGWPNWPGSTPSPLIVAEPSLDGNVAPIAAAPAVPPISGSEEPPAAAAGSRALPERRPLGAWETLLLVFLFLGVVVAALWALVANGVFSPAG